MQLKTLLNRQREQQHDLQLYACMENLTACNWNERERSTIMAMADCCPLTFRISSRLESGTYLCHSLRLITPAVAALYDRFVTASPRKKEKKRTMPSPYFSNTITECLFVLTVTFAFAQSTIFSGMATVMTDTIGRDLQMNGQVVWITSACLYVLIAFISTISLSHTDVGWKINERCLRPPLRHPRRHNRT
jgi:hypothetical protein